MAGAGSTARVDGWIIKNRVDIEANVREQRQRRPLATVQYVRHVKESRSRSRNAHVRVADDVAGTDAATTGRRAKKGVVMSHSERV